MSEERYYVREQRIDHEDDLGRCYTSPVWYIRDRLYNCIDVARIERREGSHDGLAVTRGRANGLCIRRNREYDEWLAS